MSREERREPSLWADLLNAGPDLDEGDLNDLNTPPTFTSPALTLGEAPLSSDPSSHGTSSHGPSVDESSVDEFSADEFSADESSVIRPVDEFDQFEALDELTPLEKRSKTSQVSQVSGLSEDAEALDVNGEREELGEGIAQPSRETITRLTEAQLKRVWLSRYSAKLSALIFFVLLGLLAELLLTTPLLRITEVTLTRPSVHLSADEIKRLFQLDQVQLNALSVNTDTLKAQLEKEPWVIHAEVSRRLPHQLEITLEEHQPVGVAVFDTLYAINTQGEPIAPISPSEAIGLPLISGVPYSLFLEGKEHIGRALLTLGLEVSQLYRESGLEALRPISEVYISETGYVELLLKQTRVSLGRADFTRHFKNLGHILRALKRKQVDAQYILLSADFTRAIVKEIPAQIDEEVSP